MFREWFALILWLASLALLPYVSLAQGSAVLCTGYDRARFIRSLSSAEASNGKHFDSTLLLPEEWCFTLREQGNPGNNDHRFIIVGPVTRGQAMYRGIDLSHRWWPDKIALREASRPYAEGIQFRLSEVSPPQYSSTQRPSFRLQPEHPPLVTISFDAKRPLEDTRAIDAWIDRSVELGGILDNLKTVLNVPEDPVDRLMQMNSLEEDEELAQLCLYFARWLADTQDTLTAAENSREILREIGRIRALNNATSLPLAEGYYRTAIKRLAERDTSAALEALSRSIAADPFHTGALETLARVSLIRNDLPAALKASKGLHKAGTQAALESQEHLLPLFTQFLETMHQEEDHTGSLTLADTLIRDYSTLPDAVVSLENIRLRSRMASIEAYLNVAGKARREGRLSLAVRYEKMAEEQRKLWGIPELPADSTGNKDGKDQMAKDDVHHIDSQSAEIVPPIKETRESLHPNQATPLSSTEVGKAAPVTTPDNGAARTTVNAPSMSQDALIAWINGKGEEGSYAAWKGEAKRAESIRDSLNLLLVNADPIAGRSLKQALYEIDSELQAARCRRATSESGTLLFRMRQAVKQEQWENASGILIELQELNDRCKECDDLAWPELSEKQRIQAVNRYLNVYRESVDYAAEGKYQVVDSLLDAADHHYRENFPRDAPLALKDRIQWATGLSCQGYLKHLTLRYIHKGNPEEGLRGLKALHALGQKNEGTSQLQELLGIRLAEKDLTETQLRNPITLLAVHVGSDPWFDVLRKAYRKRFNKG